MISDISGTPFTYSFLTIRPVIFFSPDEELFKKEHENLNHFQDRNKIGVITNKVADIIHVGKDMISNQNKYTKPINDLRNNLENIKTSKNSIHKIIKNILS